MATWTIAQTDFVLLEDSMINVINNLHWRVSDEETVGEETYYASVYGTQGVPTPSPDSFIPYNSVTEEECITWCTTQMGEEQVTSIEEGLAAQIELQKNPVDGAGVPW
jgi:hypothetical protein